MLYVERAERVIDLYVDILLPLLMADHTTFGVRVRSSAEFYRPYHATTQLVNGVSELVRAGGDRGPDPGDPGIGRPWSLPPNWYVASTETTTAALRHAVGDGDWSTLAAGFDPAASSRRFKSLEGGPGVIVLQPQPALRFAARGRPLRTAEEFRYAYFVNRTIELYSGQQLLGTGEHVAVDFPDLSNERGRIIGRQIPYLRWSTLILWPDGADGAAMPSSMLRLRGARSVAIRNLSLRRFDLQGPPIPCIDAEDVSDTLISQCSIGKGFSHPIHLRGGRRNWVELVTTSLGDGIAIEDEDSTLWHYGGGGNRVYLGGKNNQLWCSVVESNVQPVDDPTTPVDDPSEVVIDGPGNGLFACRIEGVAVPSPSSPDFFSERGRIRVASGADIAHVAASHIPPGGFPIFVENDSAGTLVRHVPLRSPGAPLPLLDVGLSNLLVDSTFTRFVRGDGPWMGAAVGASLTEAARRALPRGLQLRMVGSRQLKQRLDPDARIGVESVADKTFSAGCWLSVPAGAEGWLELRALGTRRVAGRRVIGPVRVEQSNHHPADGKFQFLSVLLQTTADTTAVELSIVLRASRLATVRISEPMLVRGAWLPPYRPRPIYEGFDDVSGTLRVGAITITVPLRAARLDGVAGVGDPATAIRQAATVLAYRDLAEPAWLQEIVFGVGGHLPDPKSLAVAIRLSAAGTSTPVVVHADRVPGRWRPERPIGLAPGTRCELVAALRKGARLAGTSLAATLTLSREA